MVRKAIKSSLTCVRLTQVDQEAFTRPGARFSTPGHDTHMAAPQITPAAAEKAVDRFFTLLQVITLSPHVV
jgi:hypothetical protein